MISWGFVEVVGYTPAVASADAMVKAADVNLVGIEVIGGGYVTVGIMGEIGAVKAAIDAGTSAAQAVGKVHCSSVLARPAEGVGKIINMDFSEKKDK